MSDYEPSNNSDLPESERQCLRCGQLSFLDDVESTICEDCRMKEWEKDQKHLKWEYERSRF